MRCRGFVLALAALPLPALAQDGGGLANRPNTILVTATGTTETAPDIATISLTIRGEGKTPDAATAALAAKQTAVFAGLRRIDAKAEVRTGSVEIREIRKGDCANQRFDSDSMALMADELDAAVDAVESGRPSAKGPCTVVGAVAETEATVIIASVKDAGTAVGLAGRLGASSAKTESFGLRDDSAAGRQAIGQAIVQARAQAEAIAAASKAKLGPLVSVVDMVAGSFEQNRLPAATEVYNLVPALSRPPIVVDVSPTPVETRVRLLVTFALIP